MGYLFIYHETSKKFKPFYFDQIFNNYVTRVGRGKAFTFKWGEGGLLQMHSNTHDGVRSIDSKGCINDKLGPDTYLQI